VDFLQISTRDSSRLAG